MAYGMRINGFSNTLQIDGDTPYLSYVAIQGSGTSIQQTEDDVLFVQYPTSTGSNVYFYTSWTGEQEIGGVTYYTKSFYAGGTNVTANYVLLRPSNLATLDTSQTYGIQIKSSDGNIAFDSRAIANTGFTVTSAYDTDTFPGNSAPGAGTPITLDLNDYVSMEHSWGSPVRIRIVNAVNYGGTVYTGIWHDSYIDLFERIYLTNLGPIFVGERIT